MISNCGHDEQGRYKNGMAGDQTGGEYIIRSWYTRPWKCVLRYPEEQVGACIGSIATYAANNACIGYDQNERLSYYNALRNANWHPENIRVRVETDCSASTAANIIAAGNQLGIAGLKRIDPSLTTYNMRAALVSAGFQCLTDSMYLTSDKYLMPGDIILNDTCHVAINVTYGPLYKKEGTTTNVKTVNYAAIVKVSDFLNVRQAASQSAAKVQINGHDFCLPNGLVVAVCAESDGWCRLAGTSYWVSKIYLKR